MLMCELMCQLDFYSTETFLMLATIVEDFHFLQFHRIYHSRADRFPRLHFFAQSKWPAVSGHFVGCIQKASDCGTGKC